MCSQLQNEAQMSQRLRAMALGWLIVAVLIAIASFVGKDTAIIGGWLFLIWTIPFGVIWWFYLYQHALALGPPYWVQPIGTVAVIAISFVFWFVWIPKVHGVFRQRG